MNPFVVSSGFHHLPPCAICAFRASAHAARMRNQSQSNQARAPALVSSTAEAFSCAQQQRHPLHRRLYNFAPFGMLPRSSDTLSRRSARRSPTAFRHYPGRNLEAIEGTGAGCSLLPAPRPWARARQVSGVYVPRSRSMEPAGRTYTRVCVAPAKKDGPSRLRPVAARPGDKPPV